MGLIPCLYMLVGVAGSGKSTAAKRLAALSNRKWISSDKIREELWGNAADQRSPNIIFEEMFKRTVTFLQNGVDVIYDATNLRERNRVEFLEKLKKEVGMFHKKCVVCVATFEECCERQNLRERKVPQEVILKQMKNFEVPFYNEGWEEIEINFPNELYKKDYKNFFLKKNEIPHDNHNHSMNVIEHCFAAESSFASSMAVTGTGLYHDIGKYLCKEFKNREGKETEEAHYYGHENVSAYLSLLIILSEKFEEGYLNNEELVYRAKLIELHMRRFSGNTEKLGKKFGKRFYSDLKEIWAADIAAH